MAESVQLKSDSTQAEPQPELNAEPQPESQPKLQAESRLELRRALGIDFGTSGARAIVINPQAEIEVQTSVVLTEQTPATWKTALFELIHQIPIAIRQRIKSIAINGTSSTVLLCDAAGVPLAPPLLYNDDRGQTLLEPIRAVAPPDHTVVSSTSSLAKLLWWMQDPTVTTQLLTQPCYFLHQADWIAWLLHGQLGISDYHNALKLGYDVENLAYPRWLQHLNLPVILPQVKVPGTPIAPVTPAVALSLDLPTDCWVCAGTTDSIAAFIASGATQIGEAVTSLGSTLVLKLLSTTRIEAAQFGIYSHRLGDLWLVGGASNTGGAVLQQFFTSTQLQQLSPQIQPDRPTHLNYYPLLKPGERFPINDPTLRPRLHPRPQQPAEFLQALLEGIARIEAEGYQLLQRLGATSVQQIYTAGGGAQNSTWTQIRSRYLQVPVLASQHTEAAYGTALLAHRR